MNEKDVLKQSVKVIYWRINYLFYRRICPKTN